MMRIFESVPKYSHDFSRWYHGRLDRFQSEDRLRNTERHGRLIQTPVAYKPQLLGDRLVFLQLGIIFISVSTVTWCEKVTESQAPMCSPTLGRRASTTSGTTNTFLISWVTKFLSNYLQSYCGVWGLLHWGQAV